MTEKCIKAFVSGRVQGVFFRESTRRQAQNLGLTGYAINLSDGRVEVLACGDAAQLERLVHWLHSGPEYARVTHVDSRTQAYELHNDFTTG
jgi:acylphosphatase